MRISSVFRKKKNIDSVIILIDPDKIESQLLKVLKNLNFRNFLVGGSILSSGKIKKTIQLIKKQIPKAKILLFPGDETQIDPLADGMLLPVLISGRNPDYLIGKHVKAAKEIQSSKLEIFPTGYILIKGDRISTTEKISKTEPISSEKLIEHTAIAGEQLGLKLIYLEAGSGAKKNIATSIIKKVRKNISIPLIVGGGINTTQKINDALNAGADYVVIGNHLEKHPSFAKEIAKHFS